MHTASSVSLECMAQIFLIGHVCIGQLNQKIIEEIYKLKIG